MYYLALIYNHWTFTIGESGGVMKEGNERGKREKIPVTHFTKSVQSAND